jgi:hypothetical protein
LERVKGIAPLGVADSRPGAHDSTPKRDVSSRDRNARGDQWPPKQVFDPNAKKTHGVSGGKKIPGAKSPAQGRAFRNQQRLDQNL